MELKLFSKYSLLCETGKYFTYYHKGFLLVALTKSPNVIIYKKRIAPVFPSCSTFLSRLLRLNPRAAINLDEKTILFSSNGKIYKYDIELNEISVEHSFDKGMNNPLSFCKGPNCILYGEYIWNESKGPVSIFSRINGTWIKVYSFPNNSITHIHNILYNDIDNCYYILTGDADSESGIWKADLSFSLVEPIIVGSQQYRSCCACIIGDELFYATDTPIEDNYFYSVKSKNKSVKISKLPGSVIYGRVINNHFYFSTTVEPDSTISKWRYRFTRKLGSGIADRYSHIFVFSKEKGITEICKLEKDFMPMWLFQFGNVLFPSTTDEKIYLVPQSIKHKHGKTYIFE